MGLIAVPRRAARLGACSPSCWALPASACRGRARRASSDVSPPCLPATLEHTATLAGAGRRRVARRRKPTRRTRTRRSASWARRPAEIREVSVVGQRSGAHSGRLHGYSQGDGASFVPDTPFDPGERVAVRADRSADGRTGRQGGSSFTFASTPHIRRRAPRSSPTRRRRPPTIRASTPCPASRPRS